MDAVVFVARFVYTGALLEVVLDLAGGVRDDEVHRDVAGEELFFDLLEEEVEAETARGGDVDFIAAVDRELRERVLPVGLIHDVDDRDGTGAELLQGAGGDVHVHLVVRIRAVDDLEYQVGIDCLLERRAEGVDEVVREVVNEADGVGQEEVAVAARGDLPDGSVEGREEHVLHHDFLFLIRTAGLEEPVHERRLAGVRVADERDLRDAGGLALAALRVAVFRDLAELLSELGHVLLDAAAVELDLGLTGALVRHGAAGAALPAQILAQPDETRKHVLQLRVVDLELRFLRAGAVREDVEDQVGSVNDFDLEVMREVRKL